MDITVNKFLVILIVHIITVKAQYASYFSQGLTTVPTNIPKNTTILTFTFNQINQIKAGDFLGLNQLTQLWLNYNKLTVFPDLSTVGKTLQVLYIGSNLITDVSPHVLTKMTALRYLSLDINQLTVFPDLSSVGKTLDTLDLS